MRVVDPVVFQRDYNITQLLKGRQPPFQTAFNVPFHFWHSKKDNQEARGFPTLQRPRCPMSQTPSRP